MATTINVAAAYSNMNDNSGPLIITIPNIRSGKPHIVGRRITVSDVTIWHEQMAMTPRQIAAVYDLTLAQVCAALAHYHAHRDEIEAEIEESVQFAAALQRQAPSPLDRKLQTGNAHPSQKK